MCALSLNLHKGNFVTGDTYHLYKGVYLNGMPNIKLAIISFRVAQLN